MYPFNLATLQLFVMSVMTAGSNAFRNFIQTKWVIQTAVILFVLGASAALALKPSLMTLAGVLSIGGLLLFLHYPELGLILTLIGGFAVPFYGPSGLNITMIGVAGLLGLWLFQTVLSGQKISWGNYPFMKPMFALIIVSTIALLVGQLPWFRLAPAPLGAQIASLFLFVLSIGAFFFVAFRFRDMRWLQALVFVFILYAPLKIIEWLVPSFSSYTVYLFQYGSDGSQFWLWMVVLIFGQGLFNGKLFPPFRLVLFGMLAVILYVSVVKMSDWKSGWVPAGAAIAATIAFRWPKLGVIGGSVAGVLGAGALTQSLIGSDSYSYSTRLDAWSILLEMVKVNPITGLGPANYYGYTPLFPIRGYDVEFNSHSQYVDMIMQTGILGLICFIWIGIAVGWYGWGVLQRTPKGGFAYAYVVSAMGGLAAMYVSAGLGDWILPFFYNVSLNGFRSSVLGWLFLGGIVLVDRLICEPLEGQQGHGQSGLEEIPLESHRYTEHAQRFTDGFERGPAPLAMPSLTPRDDGRGYGNVG